MVVGGGERDRTDDPLLAKQVLSQLSYTPSAFFPYLVGLVGLEPTTPALSRRCSNQLSYRPRTVLGCGQLGHVNLAYVTCTTTQAA